jgi:hypothetical protein
MTTIDLQQTDVLFPMVCAVLLGGFFLLSQGCGEHEYMGRPQDGWGVGERSYLPHTRTRAPHAQARLDM